MNNTPHLKPQKIGTPGLSQPGVIYCLQCIGEHKAAVASGLPGPPVRPAVTWVPMPVGNMAVITPACYEHVGVAQSSALVGPNGQPQGRLIT